MHRKRNPRVRTRFAVIDGQLCEFEVRRSWLPVIGYAVIFAAGAGMGMLAILTGLAR